MKGSVIDHNNSQPGVINTSSLLRILAMPLVEVLFFKKAIKGVIKFLLSKVAAFILKKVRNPFLA
jgi:hypothetical protein